MTSKSHGGPTLVPKNSATGERLSDTPTLHLYKIGENGSQEALELLKDFTVAEYDVKVEVSTEHTRDPNEELAIKSGDIVQRGKRKFVRLVLR